MIFKRIGLVFAQAEEFLVQLKFEVATARAEGCHLLRIDITERQDSDELTKMYALTSKSLRAMKQKGIIQFFAFPGDFERHSTEAVFLLNKYSEYVVPELEANCDNFLFLKL